MCRRVRPRRRSDLRLASIRRAQRRRHDHRHPPQHGRVDQGDRRGLPLASAGGPARATFVGTASSRRSTATRSRSTRRSPRRSTSDSAGHGRSSTKCPGRIENVGVEDLRLVSQPSTDKPHDEEHAWYGVTIENVAERLGPPRRVSALRRRRRRALGDDEVGHGRGLHLARAGLRSSAAIAGTRSSRRGS